MGRHGDEETSHHHDHGATGGSMRRLGLVALINAGGFALELAGGLLFGSVALLADASHMLFDGLAYGMAFGAAAVADRYGRSERFSFGLHRLEPLAAFLNGLLLVPMVGFILYESYQRFLAPADIATGPTLVVATGGLIINLLSVYVLEGRAQSLNERGAFYHLVGDAGASVAVILSTLAIRYTGVAIVDPITAAIIAVVVLYSAASILRGSAAIFLGAAPIGRSEIEQQLCRIDGVEEILDCHTLSICSELSVATVEVHADVDSVDAVADLTDRIHEALRDLGIDHATVELSLVEDCPNRCRSHGH